MTESSSKRLVPIVMLIPLLLFSCIRNNDSKIPEFPDTPTNLIEFNSEFDDYNSTAPTFGETFPFCFSSNRNSQGDNFDIIYMLMSIEFVKDDQELNIYHNTSSHLTVVSNNTNISKGMNRINTTSNEYGPYLIPQGLIIVEQQTGNRYESYIILYSSEEGGNQDIRFTQNIDDEDYIVPVDLEFLNTEFDEAYPSLNTDMSGLFFASNRDGKYDIYSHELNTTQDILEVLNNTSSEPIKENILSSDFDDTCPYIIDNMLVFTSNREGGFGGYDLYYSMWENDQWSEPINFGDKVNTEFDEFRPIVRKEFEFENDIMIFSSNRPGGQGGFDLYFVGTDKLRE